MAKFFIDRPIFAWVIAIIIMLAGHWRYSIAYRTVSTVAPPAIQLTATYPGAMRRRYRIR